MTTTTEREAIVPLRRDLRRAAATLSEAEARFLVDYYYQMQKDRIRAGNQIHAMTKDAQEDAPEPHDLLLWLHDNSGVMERNIRSALGVYADSKAVGRWALSITGIGPVITAGLLAHIDITKAATAGAIWRFAGLDPTSKWNRGEKRPWNASLKRLCWIIGESFVKVQNRDGDVYGHLYVIRKASEEAKNEAGDFIEQAERILAEKKIGKETEAYKAYSTGKLPKGQIHERSKRWAVKLFLAHFHHVAYEVEYDRPPPMPYVITHMGHVEYLGPPNWPSEG